ncbi:hypothetical protein QUF72_12550 [Desulfobacterales bacterium HSG2]|nr:hypothetical protein [Desulfobacterales bacterium HSG2]
MQTKPFSTYQTPYQRLYGLRENPFPALAMFAPEARDPRRDGRIYDGNFHKAEKKEFFDLFVQPPSGDEPLKLGFVRVNAFAGSRGNGKSAFLHHIAECINKQRDSDLFALAVHVLPEPRNQRHFWQFIYLIFETLAEKELFSEIDMNFRVALLLRLLSEEQTSALSQIPGPEIRATLLSDNQFKDLLNKYGFTLYGFIEEAERQMKSVAGETFNKSFFSEFFSVNCSMVRLWNKWKEDGLASNSYQWRKLGTDLFTGGLAPVTIIAGYQRFYVLLDEFEKIYISQTNRERDEFLDSLRQYFYERDTAILRNKYITTVLTIHPSICVYLARNWHRVGLDGLAPLDPDRMAECSVELGESTPEKLSDMMNTYIDFFREKEDDPNFNTLYPFSEDALVPAILEARKYPGGTLCYANMILQKAAQKEIPPPIPRDFVETFIEEETGLFEDEDLFDLFVRS